MAYAVAISRYAIGETARQTAVSTDTLRYYEKIGLLAPIARDAGGRRRYEARGIARIRFIRRAQRCNFSLNEIAQLWALRDRCDPARAKVQRLTEDKLAEINTRMADLERLHGELAALLELCRSRNGGGCPIIEGLDSRAGENRDADFDLPSTKTAEHHAVFNAPRISPWIKP